MEQNKAMKWKLVPEELTEEMENAAIPLITKYARNTEVYKAIIAAAPQPEHDRMTKEEAQAMQDWKGMDGAIAFHLIERHADGWNQISMMMTAWLNANKSA
jgi:hypothetical protein